MLTFLNRNGGKRGVVCHGQANAVRTGFTAGEVRRFAKQAKDGGRRLLAIAAGRRFVLHNSVTDRQVRRNRVAMLRGDLRKGAG